MEQTEKRKGGTGRVWVPVVLIIGVAIGAVLAAMPSPATEPWRGHGRGGWGFQVESPDDVNIILSTVSIALLAALLMVYSKTYRETKAKFALGLVAVLLALLLQSVLSSPLVYGAFGQSSGGLGVFLLFAEIFKMAAFTVFLYLSLE